MKHLVTIDEISHCRNGEMIWRETNLKNIFHDQGEEFVLGALFAATDVTVPSFYYLGLDNRNTLIVTQEIQTGLVSEPTTNGYSRQPVSSATGFTVAEASGVWSATSLIVSFTASGGSWGPIKNVFLTNRNDNNGYLIASVSLGTTRTLVSGDTLSLKFSMSLRDG